MLGKVVICISVCVVVGTTYAQQVEVPREKAGEIVHAKRSAAQPIVEVRPQMIAYTESSNPSMPRLSVEQMRQAGLKSAATRGREAMREGALKGAAKRTREERSEASRQAQAARSPEARKEAAQKAAETWDQRIIKDVCDLMAFPGAFLARAFVERMPVHVHTAILDAVVVIGGAFLVIGAFTR